MSFTLPKFEFEYDSLEPHIDEATMKVHHSKHHQGYVDKLNKAVEGTELGNKEINNILKDIESVPEDKRKAVINNGGGVANHSFFWEILSSNSTKKPSGKLLEAINEKFGSFDKFKEEFSEAAATRFGSGWAWLIVNKNGELEVLSTANQDSPLMDGNIPILTLDVWEHAYYLKYQNLRPKYIEAFWNVINWEKVEEFFEKARE
jgi:Fe-Mn family superoxide dismutase